MEKEKAIFCKLENIWQPPNPPRHLQTHQDTSKPTKTPPNPPRHLQPHLDELQPNLGELPNFCIMWKMAFCNYWYNFVVHIGKIKWFKRHIFCEFYAILWTKMSTFDQNLMIWRHDFKKCWNPPKSSILGDNSDKVLMSVIANKFLSEPMSNKVKRHPNPLITCILAAPPRIPINFEPALRWS